MHIFKNRKFEVGVNLDTIDVSTLRRLFEVMRECPECGVHEREIDELEHEVWREYFLRGLE
ncbi:MAG: hypothetical protein ACYTAF_02245 [Planctomycetota bacterium]|jgi:hypothetical protein